MNALRMIFSLGLLAVFSSEGVSQSPELPISAGLVVHIGSSDGAWECAWAKSGTVLVHGLTLDAESLARSRSAIQKQGLYGLASVEEVTTFKKLPYAGRLVHVVVADLDALGDQGPALAEIRRVLTPNGIALLKQKGVWQRHVEPMPGGMDEWNHWDRAADGNSLSRDAFIKPATGIRWFTSPSRAEPGNFAGMLSNEGRIYYHAKNPGREETDSDEYAPKGTGNFFSRDAYNGLLLWKNPLERDPRRHAMAAIGGKIYFAHPETGKLAVLDGKTGKRLHDLSDAMPIATLLPKSFLKQNQDDRTLIRVEGGTLFQAYKKELRALTLDQQGKLLWKFDGAKGLVRWFVVAEGKVFVLVAQKEASLRGEPYCHVVDAIVALNSKTGRKLWSNGDYAGLGLIRMIYDDHGVVLPLIPDLENLNAGKYSQEYRVVRLDAATGKPTWDTAKNSPEAAKNPLKASGHNQVPIAAHGNIYIGNQTGFALDAKTGELTKKFN